MMKKLSGPEVRDTLGTAFVWARNRHWNGVGPGGITIELVELDDGRIGNIVVRFSTLVVLHPFEPPSKAVMTELVKLFHAHGFTTRDLAADIHQDLLAALEGLITTGGEKFVGVSVKELSSLGLLQVKFTYEPA